MTVNIDPIIDEQWMKQLPPWTIISFDLSSSIVRMRIISVVVLIIFHSSSPFIAKFRAIRQFDREYRFDHPLTGGDTTDAAHHHIIRFVIINRADSHILDRHSANGHRRRGSYI